MTAQTDRIFSATINLSAIRSADLVPSKYAGHEFDPVIRVFQNGTLTPGQWFVSTIAASNSTKIAIDYGQGWTLDENETAILKGFAMGVEEAMRQALAAEAAQPRHTVNGQTSEDGWPYGTRHDMDCPACVASGASFTTSPRSETYWAS